MDTPVAPEVQQPSQSAGKSRISTRGSIIFAAVAVLVALALVLYSCGIGDIGKGLPGAVERTSVRSLGEELDITVAEATLTPEQSEALTTGWSEELTLYAGEPIEISTEQTIPAEGIEITRSYEKPLPEDVTATLAYYDEEAKTWFAVPSTVSEDRLSVTAQVDHLSLWTDITGAIGNIVKKTQEVLTGAAEWTYYGVGKVFDTRVDPPTCEEGNPEWVQSAVYIETDKNNPILFCVGRDPGDPDLLRISMRVNRGFAYNARILTDTVSLENSTFGGQDIEDVIEVVGDLGGAVSDTWGVFSPEGTELVMPGEELTFTVTEAAVRAIDPDTLVLEVAPPSELAFLVSTLGRLVGNWVAGEAGGLWPAVIFAAGCGLDTHRADDGAGIVKAALSCTKDPAALTLTALENLKVREGITTAAAGEAAKGLIGRVSIYLALIGPTFSAMNFAAEKAIDPAARTVNVFTNVPKGVTDEDLLSAEVPANCRMPAQRLVNGRTTIGAPGEGMLSDEKVRVDLAGLGYDQVLTSYVCVASTAPWPNDLILIGAGGKLLGSFNVKDADPGAPVDRGLFTSIRVRNNAVEVEWITSGGCCSFVAYHFATVRYTGSKLVFENHRLTSSPSRVVEDVLDAESRSAMLDPTTISQQFWDDIASVTPPDSDGYRLYKVECEERGGQAECSVVDYSDDLRAIVHLVSDSSVRTGWRVTGVE